MLFNVIVVVADLFDFDHDAFLLCTLTMLLTVCHAGLLVALYVFYSSLIQIGLRAVA